MGETGSVGIFFAFLGGVVSFLSPCVLPLVPSYLSFVTGVSLEDMQEGVDRKVTLTHATLFVVGFSLVFIVLGATATFIGQFIRAYEIWLARAGGVIIILLGLHLVGLFKITPLLRERRIHLQDKPAGYLGTLGVGAAFGAGWTPCIGPVLSAILGLASAQETIWQGMGLLTVYSIGLAVPFILSALALDRFLQAFSKFRRFLPAVQVGSGILLIVLGILLVTGRFTWLTGLLNQYTPEFIFNLI